MTLEELLAHISKQLEELSEREAAGEDVSDEKDALAAQKKEIESKLDTPEDELTRLRKQAADSARRETAREIAAEIVSKALDQERKEKEQLTESVRQEVATLMGGGDIQTVVKSVLKDSRAGSRYAGEGSTPEVVDHLANGGSIVPNGSIHVEARGAKAEAKAIRESKNLGSFFGLIAKAHRGEMWLTDGEKHFMREIIGGKAMAESTDSAGGYLVPAEWMPDILGLLRSEAVVRQAGPRVIPFNKLMNQTSISSGASASYTGENLRITPSELTFAEAPLLSPKNLTALVPVSNYLLADAANADGLIRADMVEVMALREDLSFLRGTGTSGEPLGLRNKVGVTLNPLTVPANGFQPTLADLRRIRSAYRNANAGAVDLVWFFHPAFLAYLETRVDSDGRFLLDSNVLQYNEDAKSGTVDGTRFYTTTQIPINLTQGGATNATDIMLVNIRETIIGVNQELEVAVSNEASWTSDGTNWNSAFQQNQTLFRTVLRHDIAHRRPSQIIIQTGVLV